MPPARHSNRSRHEAVESRRGAGGTILTKSVSCGVVIVDAARELFLCHATGTSRWDLPKGLADPGESPRSAAVREAREEAALSIEPDSLHDLGPFAYLPGKTLHLFALRVAADAFRLEHCRCVSTFSHRTTGQPIPEVDAYTWQPNDRLEGFCGKNLTRVLKALDWSLIQALPEISRVVIISN